MLPRSQWLQRVSDALDRFPVVGLVGSRQVGKTTLARQLVANRADGAVYLDLERPADLAKLAEAELFLESLADRLVVLDEVQQAADLFPLLRSLVDRDRRPGRFLVLGSASPALLRQSSESLAGRVRYLELGPFLLDELADAEGLDLDRLWVRGGYPESLLAATEPGSLDWRTAFVRTYLERDLPQLGLRVPASAMQRAWSMLAHWHGQLWNASNLARSLGITGPTVRRYLDVLCDAFLCRALPPLHVNLKKRLVKAPRVYFRDAGLLHATLGIASRDALFGHPVAGPSFEGLVIEHAIAACGDRVQASFYRAHTGAELDLVLDHPDGRRIGVEVKLTSAPRVSRSMRSALSDLSCDAAYVVTPASDRFPLAEDVEAIGLLDFIRALHAG